MTQGGASLVRKESIVLLRSQMDSEAPTPETMDLLQAVWPKLTSGQRQELLQSLGKPPVPEDVAGWEADHELHRSLLRQWRWLAGIAAQLDEPWKAAYESLAAEFGEGDSEPRPYRVMTRMGSRAPLASREIADLGPAGFSDWLSSWRPQTGVWDVPTPAGLAIELAEAVKKSPETWLSSLPELLQRLRHPTYIRGVLIGIREAASDSNFVPEWSRLLTALEVVVDEPWPVEVLTSDPFDSDPDWSESHRETMRLLQEALDRDTAFGPELLDRIWSLLTKLMRKRGRESGVLGSEESLTLAINKSSTIALRTMFSLTLSVSRQGGSLELWGERLAEAVAEEFQAGNNEAQLAGVIAASLFPQFVHVAGFGATALVPALFGSPEPGAFSEDALKTLVRYARPITNEMLLIFYPYLQAYFHSEPSDVPDESQREAVRWLVIGYIRQVDGQQSVASLMALLSHPQRISDAAEFYGRVLKDTSEPDQSFIVAALSFWDEALAEHDLDESAFRGFGWWSEGQTIDDDAWLTRTLATLVRTKGRIDWEDEVVQRLIRLRDRTAAWEALALLVRGAPERWTVSYWARHLQDLFERTEEVDEPIRSLRSELAERLVERELLDFRRYIR